MNCRHTPLALVINALNIHGRTQYPLVNYFLCLGFPLVCTD
jgi:hypothetical protein